MNNERSQFDWIHVVWILFADHKQNEMQKTHQMRCYGDTPGKGCFAFWFFGKSPWKSLWCSHYPCFRHYIIYKREKLSCSLDNFFILEKQPKETANKKEYFDKHTDNIAKKINEMGGMEDTIGRMEDSLSKNEVKSFKKKQVLANMNQDRKYLFSSPPKTIPRAESGKLRDSWINRSKEMRESFMTKFHIDWFFTFINKILILCSSFRHQRKNLLG